MDTGLKQRVVLVTGGSAGIGAASAVAFAREGAKVAITFQNEIPANLRLVVSGRTVKDCHPISTATAATPSAWSTVKGDRS